ncbi:hypothetical protein D3C73_1418980 [compost metagenome]
MRRNKASRRAATNEGSPCRYTRSLSSPGMPKCWFSPWQPSVTVKRPVTPAGSLAVAGAFALEKNPARRTSMGASVTS